MGRRPGDVLTTKGHLSMFAHIKAGDDVEQRRLSRTIGTDEANDLAIPQVEADTVKSAHAAKSQRHVTRGENMIIFAGKSSLRRLLRDRRRIRALRMPEQQYTQPLERSDKTIGGENED